MAKYNAVELFGNADNCHDLRLSTSGVFGKPCVCGHGGYHDIPINEAAVFDTPEAALEAGRNAPNRRDGGLIGYASA